MSLRRGFGYTLSALQLRQPPSAGVKRVSGIRGVWEVRKNFDETYWHMYSMELEGRTRILHEFKQKAHSGLETPREDRDLVKESRTGSEAV